MENTSTLYELHPKFAMLSYTFRRNFKAVLFKV